MQNDFIHPWHKMRVFLIKCGFQSSNTVNTVQQVFSKRYIH